MRIHFDLTGNVRYRFSNIATRWAADEGSPPEWSRNQAAFVLGQLTQVTEPQVEPRPQKRIQINRQLRPLFLYGHLTPLSRTLVSTRESIPFRVPPSSQCFQGGKPAFLKIAPLRASLKFHGRGFHQTTTIGPAGLHCCLDYAGLAEGGAKFEAGSD